MNYSTLTSSRLNTLESMGLQKQFFDKEYCALKMSDWNNIIKETHVDRAKYLSERVDCDNFAAAFASTVALEYKVNAVGITVDYTARHAYNLLIVESNHGLYYLQAFEPQNDRLVSLGSKGYEAKSGFVMFL